MQDRFAVRLKITVAVVLFYFLPWMMLAFYTGWMLSPAERWTFLSIALCTVLLGTLLLILCIHQFENKLEAVLSDAIPSKSGQDAQWSEVEGVPYMVLYEETLEQLKKEESSCKEFKERTEREQQQHVELHSTLQAEKVALQAELEEERQRADNFQKQIIQMETSTRDLKYEIKALLESTSTNASTSRSQETQIDFEKIVSLPTKPLNGFLDCISTLSSAESQLKLCVEIAQKFTGARHLIPASRFQDPSIEGYDLDLRRLTDTLYSVSGRPILFYNQREGKLLFVSPSIKPLLGWGVEKYAHDFSALFPEGQEQWDALLRQLPLSGTLELQKTLRTNRGESLSVVFHLGWVPAGIFKAHVIGILDKVS